MSGKSDLLRIFSQLLVRQGNPIIRPNACNSLHHEVELGVIIHRTCKKVSVEDAMDYVAGKFKKSEIKSGDDRDLFLTL